MSEHEPPTLERHTDVAIIGGSAAGLAAGLQLVRQRRSVIVIDAGEPRNAPAAHMHSYLGHDGLPPAELTVIGREEVRRYGGEVVPGRAVDVARTDDGHLSVELVGGTRVIARRVLMATGVVDELPDVDGLADHWGADVVACPFCHGFEVRDRTIVLIVTHPMGLHSAALWRHLTARLTIVLHEGVDAGAPELDRLRAAGVTVLDDRARRIVTGDDGHIEAVELANGDRVDADTVAITTRHSVRAEPFTSLGLETVTPPNGFGDVVETDPTGETSVPGLYAVGNATDPSQQVLQAAAHGSRVASMISFSLAHDDLEAAARPSADEADWDRRYSGTQLWSGEPNRTLVDEIAEMAPGRALDVGAGEGGDAIWLAERGWTVTASDISSRGLDRVAAVAEQRGLTVECHRADANAPEAFEGRRFDLVTAHYASIPRTPDRRGVHNLLGAVAPGGTLLFVSHDLEPTRRPVDTRQHSRAFDPEAFVRIEDVEAVVADSPDWEIERNERRTRPRGAASASHHVDDMVLRVRHRAD